MRLPLRKRLEPVVSVLLLILQPLVFYRKVLFNPRSHIPYDIESFHLPLAGYIARSIRQGVFPFWDPYPYGGVPIHADITAQLFYPLTYISIGLGNLSGGRKLFYWLEWQIPLHMILAAVFLYLLAREMKLPPVAAFLGASVFQLGGFFASQAQHLSALACAAWFPLILLGILKLSERVTVKWMALLALSAGLSILGGFPAVTAVIFFVSVCTALGLWWWRTRNWNFAAAVLLGLSWGICLSVVQLLPTYQLSHLSIATMRSGWLGTGRGLRWQSLVSLVIPNYYHIYQPFDPTLFTLPINFTFLYTYCGLFPLALLVITLFLRQNKLAKGLLACTLGCVIWMLGDSTPIYAFVFTHLPPLIAGALYAEFALLAFSLAAGLTAAAAFARLLQTPVFSSYKALPWILALATSVDLITYGSGKPMNTGLGTWSAANTGYELSGYPGALKQLREMVNQAAPPLRVDFADTAPWNLTLGTELTQVPTMDGNSALMLRRMLLFRRLFCSGNPWEREIPVSQFHSPLLRMTNTTFVAAVLPDSRAQLAASGLRHLKDFAGLYWYQVPDALPRFYVAPSVVPSSGEAETFALLARPDFAPEKQAIIEGHPEQPALGTGKISVTRYAANRIELSVSASGPAFVATSEPNYPGWTATVNGRPTPLYMTNGVFRGLYVPDGTSEIVMSYWPTHFAWWAGISAVSCVLILAALIRK